MATLAVTNPTLLDLAKLTDPDGKIAAVVEILNETNEILEDMTWMEGNLLTGHRTTIRTGIPEPTWRKLYGGVQPNKSSTRQVTDSCGMMEAYAEIDKALADLNGNTAAFRLSEDRAHIEGMNQALADALFYANETTEPEKFTGFAPRFNSLSAENADNIVTGSGSGSDNSSVWLVGWGPLACHGIVPKGSTAGLQHRDLGEVTIENVDGSGGRMQAYRTHYRWDAGLTVRDWRYIGRIPNIDKSNLTYDGSGSSADLVTLMTILSERVQRTGGVRQVFYVSRKIKEYLRMQIINKVKAATLTMETIAGKPVMMFDGIPVKRCDALAPDEAAVT